MVFDYDKSIDIAYFKINENKIVESEEIVNNIVLDYDKDENIVGLEVQHFTKTFPLLIELSNTNSLVKKVIKEI